jgi:FMN reductase (NADPH)
MNIVCSAVLCRLSKKKRAMKNRESDTAYPHPQSSAPKMTPGEFLRSLWKILAGRPQVPPSLAGNQLLETIMKRRSVRNFTQQPIPDDVFYAILEAGRLAPSTVNLQTWSFGIYTAETWKNTFGSPLPFRGQKAVMVLGDTYRNRSVMETFPHSPLVEYTVAVMNASLAAMNMNVAAEALGVSSVMLSETGRSGLLDASYIKEKLCLPDGVFPIMTIIFGYARQAYPPMPPKLPMDQVTFTGTYPETRSDILQGWMGEMKAGYKASHPFSSFDAQLQVYRTKIRKAEEDLKRMVFYRSQD